MEISGGHFDTQTRKFRLRAALLRLNNWRKLKGNELTVFPDAHFFGQIVENIASEREPRRTIGIWNEFSSEATLVLRNILEIYEPILSILDDHISFTQIEQVTSSLV